MEQYSALLRSKDRQPMRFLVVDDSVFARKNIAKMVEQFGGQIAGEAGDGLTAITEYDRLKPDMVLMDITMPQMEGSKRRSASCARMQTLASLWSLPSVTRRTWSQRCRRARSTLFRSR
jgi:Chemotaxis response regulator containing a CheY-like receiver domain and a methylesterase domain